MRSFDDLPSGDEMKVIFWAAIIVLVVGGIGAIVFSFTVAGVGSQSELRIAGSIAIIAAAIIAVGKMIVSYFVD